MDTGLFSEPYGFVLSFMLGTALFHYSYVSVSVAGIGIIVDWMYSDIYNVIP